jgi:hypothetical protein
MDCDSRRHRDKPVEQGIVYRAITVWQARHYHLDVRFGQFSIFGEANALGRQPLRLTRDGDRLLLQTKAGVFLAEAHDADISLFQVKAESRRRSWITEDDLEPVRIPIAEFCNYPDLASFGSLAFGVEVMPASHHDTRSGAEVRAR